MKSALVVEYGVGNIGSISNFLQKFDFNVEVGNSVKRIAKSDLVVLPGVGSFGSAKSNLDRVGASEAILTRTDVGKPTIGICLGFQLLTSESEESVGVQGLGLFNASTKQLAEGPVIGWQKTFSKPSIVDFSQAYYFNHAYGVFGSPELEEVTFSGKDSYIAFARKNNLVGVQFHPEKSQQAGFEFFSSILSKLRWDIV